MERGKIALDSSLYHLLDPVVARDKGRVGGVHHRLRVFFAGQPNLGNSSDDALASYQGEKGARVVTVAVADGAIKGELDLPAVPVLDGMAAAGGRLYLSLKDGTVICLGK